MICKEWLELSDSQSIFLLTLFPNPKLAYTLDMLVLSNLLHLLLLTRLALPLAACPFYIIFLGYVTHCAVSRCVWRSYTSLFYRWFSLSLVTSPNFSPDGTWHYENNLWISYWPAKNKMIHCFSGNFSSWNLYFWFVTCFISTNFFKHFTSTIF